MIIGIDLGTTLSVLAVRGEVSLTEGYPPPVYLKELDVSIIPDPFGNTVIPSAVWEDPDNPGELIVGSDACDRAGGGQSPILFSKRNIGTDVIHRLGGKEYSARDVATIILKYLKSIAEQALGERVDRAVITHPAFFEGMMLRETAEAASAAGFDFDQDKHLLMEPTAAALAYTGTDPRDPLRLLTYDLGGGTFDVTVMERRGGVVTIKAFGGNRLLGGYTFDRRLAKWLHDQLTEQGIAISVGDEDPRHQANWTRLLQIAEKVKHQLRDVSTDRKPVNIKEKLTDDRGRPATLLTKITRAQYVELIQDLLEETISGTGDGGETKGCEAILAEAGLTVGQVDEILLVGGSTWGPWVSETIVRKWDRQPLLHEPDRIVAAGAAIAASELPPDVITGSGFSVELDVDPRSSEETTIIAGQVRVGTGQASLPADLAVVLTSQDGHRYTATPGADGRFLFDEVELRPLAVTKFTLTLAAGGRDLAEHPFEVEQVDEDAEETGTALTVLTVLPKPLFIEVADGMEPLADEGAKLPTRRTVEFRRIHSFDTIEIKLFQEYDPIGSVLIKDVPPEAVVGSKVQLTVEISRSSKIEGTATVTTPRGVVVREAPVDVSILRMEVPPLNQLVDWKARLESDLEERLVTEGDAKTRMTMRSKGDQLRQKIAEALESPVPDRQETWLLLRELDRAAHPPREDMTPPRADFERLVAEIREHLSAASPGDANVRNLQAMTTRREHEGLTAHARRDPRRWAKAYDSLRTVLHQVQPQTERRRPGDDELPPAEMQKMLAGMELDQLRQQLSAKEHELEDRGELDHRRSLADSIRAEIDAAQAEVEKIDNRAKPYAALAQVQLALGKQEGISDRIRLLGVDLTK